MMANSWFPLAKGLIEEESFRTLTATEKLYLFQVMSEFNLNDGQFYRADVWFAAALNLSVEKIRKARAKLSKLGYIDMTPGKQDVGRKRNIATTYNDLKWLDTPVGDQFSQIDRPTFEMLINYIRTGMFTHDDVVCWVYIAHFCWCGGGRYAAMSKKELFHLTNMPGIIKNVRNLLSKFQFSNSKDTLFDFTNEHHSVKFESIRNVAFTQERLDRNYLDIEKRIEAIRDIDKQKEKKKLSKTGEKFAEDLLPLFIDLHTQAYGKKPIIGRNEYDKKLRDLGDPQEVAQAIESYFNSDLPKGLVNHSIFNFIKHAKQYMQR